MSDTPRALRFRAAGMELAVLLAEIQKVHDPAPILSVPYAHPALAGLMIEDDEQVPIFELRGLVDPRAPFDPWVAVSAYAIFDTPMGDIGLQVEAVLGTVEEYARVDGEDDAVAEPYRASLAGRGEAGGETFHFFSPGAFLEALDVLRPLRPSD